MQDFFRNKSWGFWIAVISVVATLGVVSTKVVYGHYFSFTMPAIELWAGRDPYAVDFANAHGHFHYSPSCALFFFALFAYLKPIVGLMIYLIAEVCFFTYALARALNAMKKAVGFDIKKAPMRNLFWLMFSSELVGSILTHKMEITIVGGVFFALALLLEGKKTAWAAIPLGIGMAFNLQPLPIIGLATLVCWLTRKDWRFTATALGTAAAVTLAALPVLGWDLFALVQYRWVTTTQDYSSHAWLAFHHVWHFVLYWFGTVPSFDWAMRIAALVGLSLAAYLIWFMRATQIPKGERAVFGWIAAFGMGSAFCVLFYPLSQSNAYTVYTPLIPTVFIFRRFLPISNGIFGGVTFSAWCLISVFYSDMVPRGFYRFAYDSALKPIGALILLVFLLVAMARSTQTVAKTKR